MNRIEDKSSALHSILNHGLLVHLKETDGNRRIGKSKAIAKMIKTNANTERKNIRIITTGAYMKDYYQDMLLNFFSLDEKQVEDIFSYVDFISIHEAKYQYLTTYYKDKFYVDDISEKDVDELKKMLPKDSLIGWYH